jgi:hypothetical protein
LKAFTGFFQVTAKVTTELTEVSKTGFHMLPKALYTLPKYVTAQGTTLKETLCK